MKIRIYLISIALRGCLVIMSIINDVRLNTQQINENRVDKEFYDIILEFVDIAYAASWEFLLDMNEKSKTRQLSGRTNTTKDR